MKVGSEKDKKLKRYIHRFLTLPPDLQKLPPSQREEADEIYIQFANQYVKALLTYCSDDIKTGVFTNPANQACSLFVSTLQHTNTHRLLHHVRSNDGTVQKNTPRQGVYGVLSRH